MLIRVRYFFPSPVGISLSPWRGGCRVGRAGSFIGTLPGNFLFFFENSKQKLDKMSMETKIKNTSFVFH